jgi:ABC-type branched-subunit amino acid transport system ATPase component
VRAAADAGTAAVILVEQQVRLVLDVCDRGYVLDRGRLKISGPAAEPRAPERNRKDPSIGCERGE